MFLRCFETKNVLTFSHTLEKNVLPQKISNLRGKKNSKQNIKPFKESYVICTYSKNEICTYSKKLYKISQNWQRKSLVSQGLLNSS